MDTSTTMHKTSRWLAHHLMRSIRGITLPVEIVNLILDKIYPPPPPAAVKYKVFPKKGATDRMLCFTPPANGRCPFMELPAELRRTIFATSLPSRGDLIRPRCGNDRDGASTSELKFVKRNRISDLMTLNKKISGEIAEIVYEERTFVIHVHEGLRQGGIEFLRTGRQPLHYQDSVSDSRFWKFSDEEKDFGFRRLKKIRIQIFPSQEESCKHSAINTYFTNLALVRLLDRNCEEKNRITSLTIEFMKGKAVGNEQGRAAIQRAEHYWWDLDKNKPRETSIHGLPNIELVLRPFANLTGCHAVNIEIPEHIHECARISVFVRDLKASMMSPYGTTFADDDLERKIESARWAMEDYVYSMMHGINHRKVDNLSVAEAQEFAPQLMELDGDAEDSGTELSRKKRELSPGKRGLSPGSKASSPGGEPKRSKTEEKMAAWQRLAHGDRDDSLEPSEYYTGLEEDEALARALEESERLADRPFDEDDEAKQLQQAIDASMADQASPKQSKPTMQRDHQDALRQTFADKTVGNLSNERDESTSMRTSNSSAFVGQGRTLGAIQRPIDDTFMPLSNQFLHDSMAPWIADSPPSPLRFNKDKVNNLRTKLAAGQTSTSSNKTRPPKPAAPRDVGLDPSTPSQSTAIAGSNTTTSSGLGQPFAPPARPRSHVSSVPRNPEYSWPNAPLQSTSRYRLVPSYATLDLNDMNDRSVSSGAMNHRSANPFGASLEPTLPNSAEENITQGGGHYDADDQSERLLRPEGSPAKARANGDGTSAGAP